MCVMNEIVIYNHRCDGDNNCNDASDELNCEKIMVPESYLNDAPPPPIDNDMLAYIFLSIEVIEVLDLNEVDAAMGLKFRITLRWKDSRVDFRNLKGEHFLNTVGRDDAAKIWYPKVTFYNTRGMEETKVHVYDVSELLLALPFYHFSSITISLSLQFSEMALLQSAHFKPFKMTTYTQEQKMS